MTTSTSRSASAARDGLGLAAAEAGEAEQLAQRALGVGRARDRLGRRRAEAGQGERSRRLPWADGHYPQPRRAPGARRPTGHFPCRGAEDAAQTVAELSHRGARRLPRRAHRAAARRARRRAARRLRGRLLRARTPTSRAAATSTSTPWSPARSRRAAKQAIVERVRHEALPCPARGLELVVYPLATARSGSAAPGFELNLNTGAAMAFRVDEQPGEIEGFWFAIDRSILRAARPRADRAAGRGAVRADPAPGAARAARRVRALAPRQRRAARRGRRPQHLPRAALHGRGDVVGQARGGRVGRGRPAVRAALAGEPLDREAVARFLDAAESPP